MICKNVGEGAMGRDGDLVLILNFSRLLRRLSGPILLDRGLSVMPALFPFLLSPHYPFPNRIRNISRTILLAHSPRTSCAQD